MKLFAMFTVCLLGCKSTKPEGGQAKTTEETAAAAAAGAFTYSLYTVF